MAPSFLSLPTEILEAIFLNLDPQSLISVSQTSKSISKISSDAPIIWRHFCQTHFQFWAPQRDIAAKYAGPLSDVDWRALFIQRVNMERETLRKLNHVLETPRERMRYINEVADYGYDAKEVLLKECQCPDDAEDVLARRYYANAILERIHRETAINTWKELYEGMDVPIERALGAYDMFARTGQDVDDDTITQDLDRLAQGIREQQPSFDDMSARMRASTIASYLRENGFNGVPDASYRALRNSFIGLVLRSSDHESLPLISVAIYCALARRLGLDARPCGFLFHVYCLVYAPKDYTLDGVYKPTSSDALDFMYLDPFRSSDEVLAGDLKRVLREMGVPKDEHEGFLSDTNTREMTMRTARNIMNSVQTARQQGPGILGFNSSWVNVVPDMDNAFYATIWAMLMLGPSEEETAGLSNVSARRRQLLPYLLEHFQTHYPWDVALLTQYVIPMFHNQADGHRLTTFVQSMNATDRMAKRPKNRSAHAVNVKFKVGQLFKHKRYRYEGVITGWDTSCDAGEDWITNMGVDDLPNGRNQAFYHVLCCDKSLRYVAEENIRPVEDGHEPSPLMMKLAGRHFKRWDADKTVFVSNIHEEYPDD